MQCSLLRVVYGRCDHVHHVPHLAVHLATLAVGRSVAVYDFMHFHGYGIGTCEALDDRLTGSCQRRHTRTGLLSRLGYNHAMEQWIYTYKHPQPRHDVVQIQRKGFV